MSDDDRPRRTRSWKEIDASKDKKGSSRPRDEYDRRQERAEKSTAYKQYKAGLDKLFTPGSGAELPESLKAKLGPPTEGSAEKAEAIKALREKADADSLKVYLDLELVLPEDPRLLMQLLDIDDEDLVQPVLSALLDIVESGKKPNRMLLIQKLSALELRFGPGEAQELAQQLRAALD